MRGPITPATPSRDPRWMSFVTAGLGAYAALGGFLTLMGWSLGIYRLTDWQGKGISMKANSALAAAAAGVALILLAFRPSARGFIRALGTFVTLMAGLTLLEHFSGWNLGIDTLLFAEPPGALATTAPGRMGIPASTSFLLLGTALVLLTQGTKARGTGAGLGVVVAAIGTLSLTGYLYGAEQMYTLPRLTAIAAQTASMILALGLGLIAGAPERQPMRTLLEPSAAGLLARRVLPLVIVVPLVLGWGRIWIQQQGLVDTAFGTALRTLVEVVLLIGLLWWAAAAVRSHERALSENRELLQTTLSSIGDAVIITDLEGRVTYLNAVAESLTGWKNGAARGQPLDSIFHIINESTRQLVANPATRTLKEGVIVGLANHTVLVARDGTERPIDDSAAPIRSEAGDIIGSVLIFRDITERHRAEDILRESEQRYRTLFESMIEGFCIVEVLFDEQQKPVDYRFVQVNPAFEKQSGLHNAEGRRMRELAPAHEQHWFDNYGRVALTGETARFENHAGALGRWFEVTATRLDPKSRRVGIMFNDITKRRRDEENLRESQARFDLVRDAAQVGFWFCDLPFDVLNWDARVKEHFWLPAEAMVTIETFYERLHREDRERVRQAIAASIANKTGYDVEYRTVAQDGREKWIRAIGRGFYDGEGKPVRFDGVTLDVTDRKQTERALHESQTHAERQRRIYEAILTNTPDFAYVFSLNYLVVYANETLLKMWGRTLEDTLGRTFLELGYETWHAEMHCREIDRVAATRQPIRGEVPFNGAFGRRIYDYIFVPVLDANGEVQAVAGTTRDVTERKNVEEALARLAAIVDSSEDAIISKTLDGIITSWNAGAERLLGYLASEMIGRSITTIIPPDRQNEEVQIQQRLRRNERIEHFETVRMTKDGRPVELSLSVSPIRDSSGRVIGASKIARDITERRRTEESLRVAQAKLEEYAALLETRVAERTSELTSANEQLEAFVYSIAHDLRTPLRSMTSFSQLLLDDHATGLNETGRNFLKRIQTASEFMDRLLLDLLAYGSTSHAAMELGPVEVEKAWASALFQNASLAEQTGAQIRVMGPLPVVHAHETTLGQCLANLLSNAIKFVAPGVQPDIRFWCEEFTPPSGENGTGIRLWMEDNGISIAPEHQERAFRVFERLHGTRYPGTGIGLSIVRKGIERMGGRVGVESTVGQGSRFWMELRKA